MPIVPAVAGFDLLWSDFSGLDVALLLIFLLAQLAVSIAVASGLAVLVAWAATALVRAGLRRRRDRAGDGPAGTPPAAEALEANTR